MRLEGFRRSCLYSFHLLPFLFCLVTLNLTSGFPTSASTSSTLGDQNVPSAVTKSSMPFATLQTTPLVTLNGAEIPLKVVTLEEMESRYFSYLTEAPPTTPSTVTASPGTQIDTTTSKVENLVPSVPSSTNIEILKSSPPDITTTVSVEVPTKPVVTELITSTPTAKNPEITSENPTSETSKSPEVVAVTEGPPISTNILDRITELPTILTTKDPAITSAPEIISATPVSKPLELDSSPLSTVIPVESIEVLTSDQTIQQTVTESGLISSAPDIPGTAGITEGGVTTILKPTSPPVEESKTTFSVDKLVSPTSPPFVMTSDITAPLTGNTVPVQDIVTSTVQMSTNVMISSSAFEVATTPESIITSPKVQESTNQAVTDISGLDEEKKVQEVIPISSAAPEITTATVLMTTVAVQTETTIQPKDVMESVVPSSTKSLNVVSANPEITPEISIPITEDILSTTAVPETLGTPTVNAGVSESKTEPAMTTLGVGPTTEVLGSGTSPSTPDGPTAATTTVSIGITPDNIVTTTLATESPKEEQISITTTTTGMLLTTLPSSAESPDSGVTLTAVAETSEDSASKLVIATTISAEQTESGIQSPAAAQEDLTTIALGVTKMPTPPATSEAPTTSGSISDRVEPIDSTGMQTDQTSATEKTEIAVQLSTGVQETLTTISAIGGLTTPKELETEIASQTAMNLPTEAPASTVSDAGKPTDNADLTKPSSSILTDQTTSLRPVSLMSSVVPDTSHISTIPSTPIPPITSPVAPLPGSSTESLISTTNVPGSITPEVDAGSTLSIENIETEEQGDLQTEPSIQTSPADGDEKITSTPRIPPEGSPSTTEAHNVDEVQTGPSSVIEQPTTTPLEVVTTPNIMDKVPEISTVTPTEAPVIPDKPSTVFEEPATTTPLEIVTTPNIMDKVPEISTLPPTEVPIKEPVIPDRPPEPTKPAVDPNPQRPKDPDSDGMTLATAISMGLILIFLLILLCILAVSLIAGWIHCRGRDSRQPKVSLIRVERGLATEFADSWSKGMSTQAWMTTQSGATAIPSTSSPQTAIQPPAPTQTKSYDCGCKRRGLFRKANRLCMIHGDPSARHPGSAVRAVKIISLSDDDSDEEAAEAVLLTELGRRRASGASNVPGGSEEEEEEGGSSRENGSKSRSEWLFIDEA